MDEAVGYGLWDSVRWWYTHLAQFTLKWELPHLTQAEQDEIFPLLKPMIEGRVEPERYQQEDMIIIGTPEMCLEKFRRFEEAGVDQLLCYVQFGDLPHDKVMHGLELLGTHVIPELEARGHRVQSTARV
jgi:alkanesulfonate monooxygenase SsuD/methylene tetrahydromethanopterin reductase-like flavin-dependent oxidoreductase (luciferase family)